MSTFNVIGVVEKIEQRTSAQGKSYSVLTVKDDDSSMIEMTVFGEQANQIKSYKQGQAIVVKGFLKSRAYTDKNGTNRFGLELRPQWIELVEKGSATGPAKKVDNTVPPIDFESIPF